MAVVTASVLLYAAVKPVKYPVYEYYNVRVLSQIAPNVWWMEKSDGRFLYRGCPDFPNDRVIWPGHVARRIRYQEQGNCKSILPSDCGFWWLRDDNGNVKTID